MYLIADTYEVNQAVYRVHAVNLSTLQDTVTPAPVVSASASLLDGSQYAFNASVTRQRASLLLSGSKLYAAFTSYCDHGLENRGWVLGWQTPTLAMLSANYLTNLTAPTSKPMQYLNTVWMSGYGLSTLKAGDNIYMATGNTNPGEYSAPSNLSESVVKLAPDLSAIKGYFTDPNKEYLDKHDLDLSAGGVMVLPAMPGLNPRLLIAAGKVGDMYLLGANQMKLLATYPIGSCRCGPSFYQGADGVYRVVSSGGSSVITWDLATSDSSHAKLTQERTVPITSGQDGGFFTTVSSNGMQPGTAIIWAVGRPTAVPGAPTLYAIDPTTGNILLQTPAGNWVNGNSNANIVPTVANGHVYVGSNGQLQVFGLPPAGAPAAAVAATTSAPAAEDEGAPAAAPTPATRGTRTVTGWIRQMDKDGLTIETRAGQSVRVDTQAAEAEGNTVGAVLGQAVEVTGAVSPNGMLLALSVMRAKPSPAFWSADH